MRDVIYERPKAWNLNLKFCFEQDYADWHARVEKAQLEKSKLDGVLRGLNDEVLHQDELLSKLNKEKKHMSDTMAKASDEFANNQVILDLIIL